MNEPITTPQPQTQANGTQPRTRTAPYYDFLSGQAKTYTTKYGSRLIYGHDNVKGRPDLEFFWVEVRDVRGGLGKQNGDLENDWDRAKSSTLDTRFVRTLTLPQLTTAATSPDPTGNLIGIHHSFIFNQMFIAVGSGNDVSLYTETSATNPTLVAIAGAGSAGRPGAAFTCAANIVLGGTTAAENLLLGRVGTVPMLMTAASGTISGTAMDAAFTSCWGAIPTPLNERTIVFYSGNGTAAFYTLKASDAINTTPPTPVLDSQPRGGYALHPVPFRLGNGPERCYWGMPYEDTPGGVLLFGTEKLHKVTSTNIEATDRQDLDFGFRAGILQAVCLPEYAVIAATDGERIVLHRGDGIEPVEVFMDRTPNSNKEYRVRKLYRNGPELVYDVDYIASSSGTGNTVRHREAYNLETGAYHQISADYTAFSSTGVFGPLSPGSGPISKLTSFAHTYDDGSWYRQKMVRWGTNPYLNARWTTGAQNSTGDEVEPAGTWNWANTTLPGLEGLPLTISRLTFMGDAASLGTGGSVTGSVNGIPYEFSAATGYIGVPQVKNLPAQSSRQASLDLSITLTRSTTDTNATRQNGNGLLMRIEGFAHRDLEAERLIIPEKLGFAAGQ